MKTSQRENKTKKNNRENKTKGKCFNCSVLAHYAHKCGKPIKGQKQHIFHIQSQERQNRGNIQWCLDSGVTSHMCYKREMFSNFVEHAEKIRFEADKHIMAKGKGDIEALISGRKITFQDVLYSPELNMNFISVGRVVANDLIVVFDSTSAVVRSIDGEIILKAFKHNYI